MSQGFAFCHGVRRGRPYSLFNGGPGEDVERHVQNCNTQMKSRNFSPAQSKSIFFPVPKRQTRVFLLVGRFAQGDSRQKHKYVARPQPPAVSHDLVHPHSPPLTHLLNPHPLSHALSYACKQTHLLQQHRHTNMHAFTAIVPTTTTTTHAHERTLYTHLPG